MKKGNKTLKRSNFDSLKKTPIETKSVLSSKAKLKSKQHGAKKLKQDYKSIFGPIDVCYFTGEKKNVVVHHIFGGPYKTASEKRGFVIAMRSDYHTGKTYSVHEDISFSEELKKTCQYYYENVLKLSREDFVNEFGKSYL